MRSPHPPPRDALTPSEVVAALAREQRDEIALWRSLEPREWSRPSLCAGWSVKDVIAHTIFGETELFHPHLQRAVAGDASAPEGLDLARLNQEQVESARGRSPQELLDEAERAVARTHEILEELSPADFDRPAWNPITPGTAGFYIKGRIWEWWTHGQDVRIPLHRPGGRDADRTRPVVEVVRDGITGVFLPERSRGVHVSYAFQVGDTGFTVRIDDGACRVDEGFDPKATARVWADPATFVLVGVRRVPQWKAVLTGKFRPSGNPIAGLKFLSYFRAP